MALLEVSELRKDFGGLRALSDLSFQLKQGEILGLIGPNGAGKTTVFNVITGFLAPTSGQLRLAEARVVPAPVVGGQVLDPLPSHPTGQRRGS